METKLKRKKGKVETVEKVDAPVTSELLELRKAQAKELATLKDDGFSINDELNEIINMLVEDDEEALNDNNEKSFNLATENPTIEEGQVLPSEDNKEQEEIISLDVPKEVKKATPKTSAKKTTSKKTTTKKPSAKTATNKTTAAKPKPATTKKTTAKSPKSKVEPSNPKENINDNLPIEEINDNSIIDNVIKTEGKANLINMIEDKKTELETVSRDNDSSKTEDDVKKFFENSKVNRVTNAILEKTEDKKIRDAGIINNLQRLREQIMAQKKLERDLMEVESLNVQKKELNLKSKLSELDSLVNEEEVRDQNEEFISMLENEKNILKEQLRIEQERVKHFLSISYNNVSVIDPESLSLSEAFLDSITAVRAEELYNELEAVQNELVELREIHEMNRQVLRMSENMTDEKTINSQRYIESFNKLKEDVENYKQINEELEKKLANVNEENEKLISKEKEYYDKAIIKKQNELDLKYINKESTLIANYEKKLDEIRNSLKNKMEENVAKAKLGLETKYKGKIKDQKTLENDIKKLTNQLADGKMILDKQALELKVNEKTINAKNQEIEELNDKIVALSIQSDSDEIIALKTKIVKLESDLEVLKSSFRTSEENLNTKANEVEALTKELVDLESKVNDEEINNLTLKLDDLNTEMNNKDSIINDLNNQINDSKIDLENLNNDLKAKTEEIEILNNKLNETSSKDDEDEINELKLELSNLLIEVNNKDNDIKNLQNQIDESNTVLDKLNNDLRFKTEEVENLNNQLAERINLISAEELNELKNKLENYNQDIINKDFQIKDINENYEILNLELVSKIEEIESLKIQLSELEGSIRKEDFENVLVILKKINIANDNKDNEILNLQIQSEENAELIRNLNLELEAKTEELSILNLKLQEVNNQVNDTNDIDEQLNNKSLEIETLKNKVEELLNKESDYQNQLESLNQLLSESQKEIEESKSLSTQNSDLVNEYKLQMEQLVQDKELLELKFNKNVEDKYEVEKQLNATIHDYSQSENEVARLANELSEIKANLLDTKNDSIYQINEELINLQATISSIKIGHQAETASFQEQINELTSELSQQRVELEKKISEILDLKTTIQDLEQEVVDTSNNTIHNEIIEPKEIEVGKTQEEVKEEVKLPVVEDTRIQDLIASYSKEKDLLSFKQSNEINKLEVELKFARNTDDITAIESEIQNLKDYYKEINLRKDQSFHREIQEILGYEIYDEIEDEVSEEDLNDLILEDSSSLQEDIINESTDDIFELEDDLSVLEEDSDDSESIENQNTDLSETPVQEQDADVSMFAHINNSEYLNKLNNIHRMRRGLETKRNEYISEYENSAGDVNVDLDDLKLKIQEIKAKISLAEQEYRAQRGYHPDREREHEFNKAKLYVELENRQEQLRKTVEEHNRRNDLKYKSLIKNINDQLSTLDEEEKELKEFYLNKQQKLQSKLNRENEILSKLEAERAAPQEETVRIIESQEEIKARTIQESYEDNYLEEDDYLEEETVLEEELIENSEEEFEDVNDEVEEDEVTSNEQDDIIRREKLENINQKENDLRQLYAKYANAEIMLSSSNKNVRDYKNIRNEILAYETEYKKIDLNIDELISSLDNDTNSHDAMKIEDSVNKLDVRKDLISKRVLYLDKQLSDMEVNGYVQEYKKVTDKLDSMEEILQKYQKAKQGLQ